MYNSSLPGCKFKTKMNRGDPEAPQRLCNIDKVHYCFVYINYETYFAKWAVGWWEIIRRPRKVWVTTELSGCDSLYSHCFSTPSVLLMKKRRTIFTVLHICIWTTDFLTFPAHFSWNEKKKKKKTLVVSDRHAGLICTLVDPCVVFGTPAEHVNVFGNSVV